MLAAIAAIVPAAAAAAERPTLPIYTAAEIPVVCDKALADARKSLADLEAIPIAQASVKSVFHGINRMQILVEDLEGPVYALSTLHPDKAVRDAAEACLLQFNEFDTDWLQSAPLYQRIRAVRTANPIDAKLKKDLVEGFEDTGVALAPAKRERLKAILKRLEEARQEFSRDIRENPARITFTPDEMRGLPISYIERLKRDDKGNYILSFEYPDYYPFMTNADDGDARRRYQFAFNNRGTPRNLAVLDEVIRLRHEMAGLFGMKSYAQFSLRRKMAKTPAEVDRFLAGVGSTIRAVALKDVETLREVKAKMQGKPLAEVRVDSWDSAYYREKLRKSLYDIDREALRQYFPSDASVAWVMHVSSVLYGIEFRPAQVPTWHPEVRYYDVHDAKSGAFIGGLYVDMYPREGKYSHAVNYGVRATSLIEGRTPYAVLVANLDRKGLDNTELETLVHEFGHAMHHILAKTAYAAHGGSNLEWDFVEAPSQMYEEWARHLESLKLISQFCTGCKTVDADLVRRMEAARKIGSGLRYTDQHLFAAYDIALYGERAVDPMKTWAAMEGATPLGHVPGTQFPGTFEHIVGGYAAGYYGYMWSEVLALDMLSPFGSDIMNPVAGRRFRDVVLSRGGERPAEAMVEQFLGRKPSNAAFIAEITGRRGIRDNKPAPQRQARREGRS